MGVTPNGRTGRRQYPLRMYDQVDGGPLVQLPWEPSEISGKSVAYLFGVPGRIRNGDLQKGFLLASGTREAAVVIVWAEKPERSPSTTRERLDQAKADKLHKASPGLPFDFTCLT